MLVLVSPLVSRCCRRRARSSLTSTAPTRAPPRSLTCAFMRRSLPCLPAPACMSSRRHVRLLICAVCRFLFAGVSSFWFSASHRCLANPIWSPLPYFWRVAVCFRSEWLYVSPEAGVDPLLTKDSYFRGKKLKAAIDDVRPCSSAGFAPRLRVPCRLALRLPTAMCSPPLSPSQLRCLVSIRRQQPSARLLTCIPVDANRCSSRTLTSTAGPTLPRPSSAATPSPATSPRSGLPCWRALVS